MQESLIALAMVLLLVAVGWAIGSTPEGVLWAGVWVTAVGFGIGVPTGAVYHVALYRALRAIDALPDDWWLRPIAANVLLPQASRGWVMFWCYSGAAGFAVIVLGLGVTTVGALRFLSAATGSP